MIRTLRWTVAAVLAGTVLAVSLFSRFLTDMWWFEGIGYLRTFWVQVGWLWGVRLGVGLAVTIFLLSNLWLTRKQVGQAAMHFPSRFVQGVADRGISWTYWLVSIALGVLYGAATGPYWQRIAYFLNRQPFGISDPIFHRDVGFYVFTLPFLDWANGMALGLLVLTLLMTGALYLGTGGFRIEGVHVYLVGRARYHLTILLAAIVGVKAWRYCLDLYNLLYSPRGAVYGATYTDIHANALALKALAVVAAVVAVAILANLIVKSTRLIVAGMITLAAAAVILGGVYPGLTQKLLVEPNELAREQEYIGYHIEMTRAAFGLSDIVGREFDPVDGLTAAQIDANKATIDNVRLWDWRPLLAAYGQLQEFRLYYDFYDVDIDRYEIGGEYRQVMLAAREMAVENLQNPTWINQHLQYTHGYGVVATPVSSVTPEGLPDFVLADIPPQGVPELLVDRPEIYYGEKTNQYVIVNTKTPEFDYPQGDENVTVRYEGSGGVQLSNPLRRMAFATRLGTMKVMLSSDITSQSRVMIYRNIHERVRRIAPFLRYDSDPYIAIVSGRLLWIQDAYTATDRFPYVRPQPGWGNYVRNSVKVVIDAFDGDVTFYMMDAHEPLALAMQRVYGDLFRPADEMPAELRAHIRYPEDLFKLQSSLFRTYHMTNTQVFYNQEDAWAVPRESVGGTQQPMEPYYTIMRLPGETREELVLLLPFTPANKDNMVAWLAARSDGDNYGKLVLYKFPKQSLTFGPSQVEARIDQDADISQMLTLWSQKGSEVIRGNLLVIPVENSLLYVEPLYLQAEQSRMPELKRVIVVEGSRVVMGTTMSEAIAALVGRSVTAAPTGTRGVLDSAAAGTGSAAARVARSFERMERSWKSGDWKAFGDAMAELKQSIEALRREQAP